MRRICRMAALPPTTATWSAPPPASPRSMACGPRALRTRGPASESRTAGGHRFMRSFATVVCALTAAMANGLFAQSQGAVAQPGAVDIEPPTIGALGVEWRIQGDDN